MNGSWLADGCELLVLSSINAILATEWALSSLQKGVLLPLGQDLGDQGMRHDRGSTFELYQNCCSWFLCESLSVEQTPTDESRSY